MLGETKAHLGQYDQAHAQEDFALQLARKFGDRAAEGRARLWLGRIALAVEDFTEAKIWLVESMTIFREVGQKDQLGSALASLGYAWNALGDITESQSCLREA